MNIFFVDGKKKGFYESEQFGQILSFIHCTTFNCRLKEGDGRCIITVDNIKNVEPDLTFIEEMQRRENIGA